MSFLVVVEPTASGFTASVPDLEGCVATARTREQVERQIRAVIEFHLAGLRAKGADVPEPNAFATRIEVMEPVPAGD